MISTAHQYSSAHQYIDRKTQTVKTEDLFFDRTIQTIYSSLREKAPFAFNLLLSARTSALLGYMNYDFPLKKLSGSPQRLLSHLKINTTEIHGSLEDYDTYRKIFERRICYWKCRPMEDNMDIIVSPADSRLLPGSFSKKTDLFIKEKLFTYTELIGPDKNQWLNMFKNGDYAVFRLTPDKYHYNHSPVSGRVTDIYEINGKFHSCNPGAVVQSVTPYSKNRRVVTIIDTDVEGGSKIGLVAMVEIVALMIGKIVQAYSDIRYDFPKNIKKGDFIQKGQPKSLFRPGSSTTIIIFQKDKIRFSNDLLENCRKQNVQSRFTSGFGKPMVETDIKVRESIGIKN